MPWGQALSFVIGGALVAFAFAATPEASLGAAISGGGVLITGALLRVAAAVRTKP